jgi:hypothetical protein
MAKFEEDAEREERMTIPIRDFQIKDHADFGSGW